MTTRQVWYYLVGDAPGMPASLVGVRDFVGSVTRVALNGTHAAVLTNGRVIVHRIEPRGGGAMGDQEPDVNLPLNINTGERENTNEETMQERKLFFFPS
jgi:hypothetical protein